MCWLGKLNLRDMFVSIEKNLKSIKLSKWTAVLGNKTNKTSFKIYPFILFCTIDNHLLGMSVASLFGNKVFLSDIGFLAYKNQIIFLFSLWHFLLWLCFLYNPNSLVSLPLKHILVFLDFFLLAFPPPSEFLKDICLCLIKIITFYFVF